MEEYPIASLVGTCSEVSERALCCVETINDLVVRLYATGVDGPDFSSGARTLQDLNNKVIGLKDALSLSQAVFVRLREVIARLLDACDRGTIELYAHLMRLHPGNLDYLNVGFMQAYHQLLQACNNLMTKLIEIIFFTEEEQYHMLNTREIRDLVERAMKAFNAAIEESNIFRDQYVIVDIEGGGRIPVLEQPASPSSHGTATAPPPYSREPQALGARIRPGVARGLNSIRNSLDTLAANIHPRRNIFATALCEAAARGDLDQIEGFLNQGANVNGRGENGKTPLQCAILSDQEGAVDLLIASGASTGGAGWSGMPPLFLAACYGSINVAEYFINTGARIDESNLCGQSYFVDVVRSNILLGVRFLLMYGVSPNTTNISHEAVLVYAVRQGNREVAEVLLQYGADVTVSDRMGRSLLDIALERHDPPMCAMLLHRWANPNDTTMYGTSLLVRELKRRRLRMVKLLVEGGADPDTQDNMSQPAIICVLRDSKIQPHDKFGLVRLLLRYGADVETLDTTHKVLHHAVATGIPMIVDMFLRKRVNPESKMKSGETGLQHVFRKGNRGMVFVFLKHHADPNFTDKKGMTPLMHALLGQDIEMIRMLRRAGAEMAPDVEAFARALGRADIFDALKVGNRTSKIRRWSL